MSDCSHHHNCSSGTSAVYQTLDEMEFERGIWYAAQYGDLERVQELIRKGTPINKKENAGYTALHYAARAGHFEVCKFLVQNGADVNAVTKSGQATPLHRAASAGKSLITQFLLESKAKAEMRDADGKTALHRSAESQNVTICKQLLNHCPELKFITDCKGFKPSYYVESDELSLLLS